jgi:signal transduction histidine kinase
MDGEVTQNLFGVDSELVAVAHELKAPLGLIRQLAFALNNDLSEKELMSIARQISATSDRALRMVSELTRVARLEEALFELEPVNPRRVCDEAVGELRKYYALNKRQLDVQYSQNTKLMVAHPELLSSIVYNLCSNALYYSERGSVSKMFVKNVDFGRKVRVGVRDFGPSLPTNIYKHLKAGFLKAPTSIAMRPESSGLGLYIVSRFADYMHGKVGAVRHSDGTTLFVDLFASNQRSLF